MKEANQLKTQMAEQRSHIMLKANEDEDQMIKKLAKQLGLNNPNNKHTSLADDGLDCILLTDDVLFIILKI